MATNSDDSPPGNESSRLHLDTRSTSLSGPGTSNSSNPRQARYWIGTIPLADWEPTQPNGIVWIRGQHERGSKTGYDHWQIFFAFATKKSLKQVVGCFPRTGYGKLIKTL